MDKITPLCSNAKLQEGLLKPRVAVLLLYFHPVKTSPVTKTNNIKLYLVSNILIRVLLQNSSAQEKQSDHGSTF